MKKLCKGLIIFALIAVIFRWGMYATSVEAAAVELFSTSLYSDANLKAYFRLSDTSATKGTTALTNNGSVAFNPGMFGNAADYGSSNSTKYLGASTVYGVSNSTSASYTINVWAYANTIPTDAATDLATLLENGSRQVMFAIENSGGNNHLIAIVRNDTTFSFPQTSNFTISTGAWHMYTLVVSGQNYEFYFDGTSKGTGTDSVANGVTTASAFNLGRSVIDNGNYWQGLIDDVSMFNRTLSSGEVSGLFSGSLAVTSVPALFFAD